jgi:hypothetical protein
MNKSDNYIGTLCSHAAMPAVWNHPTALLTHRAVQPGCSTRAPRCIQYSCATHSPDCKQQLPVCVQPTPAHLSNELPLPTQSMFAPTQD